MKIFRAIVFVFFAIALYGSVDCLLDASRALEHHGAWLSMYICVAGCAFATVNPEKLL